ncbi:MAG: BMP family ABC transporter substrate-binding protein, partial [Anaerolineae bacterium]
MPLPADILRIGLITDGGRIDDGGFNQQAYEGLLRAAQEHGIEVVVRQPASPTAYESELRQLLDEDCRLIVTVGSVTGPAVERIAGRYPKAHFIVVDYEPLVESQNMTGLVFAEDQAGFLAGALAGLITSSGTVGFIGGKDLPPIRRFQRGFANGMALTNRQAKLIPVYTNSFTDEDAGVRAAQKLAAEGVDIVFAAAGACGNAGLRAAAAQGIWVIGADQDVWITTFQNGRQAGAERVLTSAMKRVDEAVYQAVKKALQGSLRGGIIRFDLANAGVGLAPFHD